MEATLEGPPVNAHIRENRNKHGNTVLWPDSSAYNYTHCPHVSEVDHLAAYPYFSRYKKVSKLFEEIKTDHRSENRDVTRTNETRCKGNCGEADETGPSKATIINLQTHIQVTISLIYERGNLSLFLSSMYPKIDYA